MYFLVNSSLSENCYKRNKWYRVGRKKVQTMRKLRRSGKNLVGDAAQWCWERYQVVKRKCRGTKVYWDVKVLNV